MIVGGLFFWLVQSMAPGEGAVCDLGSLVSQAQAQVTSIVVSDPDYQPGFEFFASQFSVEDYRHYFEWLKEKGPFASDKERRNARAKLGVFRLHPQVLAELSRVLSILLRHAEDPSTALQKKDIKRALGPIIAIINRKGILDYQKNSLMGPIDELRAAAFYIEEGYRIVRMSYDFNLAPRVPELEKQPIGEIDIVLEKDGEDDLVLVEVKSTLRGSSVQDQLERYVQLRKQQVPVIYDQRQKRFRRIGTIYLLSGLYPSDYNVDKISKGFPQVAIHRFPERLRRKNVFSEVFQLKVFHSSY